MTSKNVEYTVHQITKSGKKVVFEKDACKIFVADGKRVACAETHNDLYSITSEHISEN